MSHPQKHSKQSDASALEAQLLKIAKDRYQSRAGDRAFTELLERHQQSLMAQVMASLHQHDLALEILQECFLRAYKALPNTREDTRIRAWLGRIAHNLCVDEIRRRKGPRGSARSLDQQEDDGRPLVEKIEGPSIEASQLALNAEAKEQVRKSVAKLNRHAREIIQLRIYDELSYKEIASILNCSEGTAKQRMYQALCDLRKIFPSKSL